MTASDFKGEIKVASRIIDYLSSGLYDSPAACLKELVNNAFDADATKVEIFVKPDADRIIIEDDGDGMSKEEFIRHFEKVSESQKRDSGEATRSGRPKVGKIGIGFIAANELCEVMEIYSTKKNSEELLHITINFSKMREDPESRRRDGGDFAKADYVGELLSAKKAEHYTQIFLTDVRGEAREILASASRTNSSTPVGSLYGRDPDSIAIYLAEGNIRSWNDLDRYSETMLKVALNVPVRYHPRWMPPKGRARLHAFEARVDSLNFSVFYDGVELFKPVFLDGSEGSMLVKAFKIEGDHVAAEGYFFAQHGTLKPQNLNGVLLRIRNAAVGEYRQDFLEFSSSEGNLFQKWISAELWADDRLEDAMNIDRQTLRVAHVAYAELQRIFHEELSKFIKEVRNQLYQARSDARKKAQAKVALRSIKQTVQENLASIDKRAATTIVNELTDAPTDPRWILKKYSVEEIYQIAIDVAKETLEPPLLRQFLSRLTKRLLG